ncbi:YdaS family helix-turn-helix protein [Burkholderia sp. JPY481]
MTRPVEALAIARAYPGMSALIRAIELCGSQLLLAQAIGIRNAKLSAWLHQTRKVPLEFVPLICAAANHPDVTPMTLRPDYMQGWALLARQLRGAPREADAEREPAALEGEPQ